MEEMSCTEPTSELGDSMGSDIAKYGIEQVVRT